MKKEIRSYLVSTLSAKELPRLGDGDSLLDAGIIDSMLMLDLIAHLERTYAIAIGEDDMVPENFDSIEAIARYVERKRSQP